MPTGLFLRLRQRLVVAEHSQSAGTGYLPCGNTDGLHNDLTGSHFSAATVGNSVVVQHFLFTALALDPKHLAAVVNGSNLDLSWPADHTGMRWGAPAGAFRW